MRENQKKNFSGPDFRDIEETLTGLRSAIEHERSVCEKVRSYNKMITLLLNYGSSDFIKANIPEFSRDFILTVENYPVSGSDIRISSEFLDNALKLTEFLPHADNVRLRQVINKKLSLLQNIRSLTSGTGNNLNPGKKELYFPVIEQRDNIPVCSFLETITLRIIKSDKPAAFLIFPANNAAVNELKSQVEKAFNTARKLPLEGRKYDNNRYEVIVTFNNSRADYVGDSFGLLLTLQFYLELCRISYPAINLTPAVNMSLTGGIDEGGRVIKIGKDLIKLKLEAAAFSDSEFIIIPREDHRELGFREIYSPGGYPERELKIIGVTGVEEIINRRDLIVIEKKPAVRRILEASVRHSRTFLLSVILVLLTVIFLSFRSDHNPAEVSFKNNVAQVKNAAGEILWSKILFEPDLAFNLWGNAANQYYRILDLNNDGKTEVLLSPVSSDRVSNGKNEDGVVLFDQDGEKIWNYNFTERAESASEGFLSGNYRLRILDFYKNDTISVVFIVANNLTSYSSALFALDALTGKRIGGSFWSSGHVFAGKVLYKKSGVPYLLLFGIDNGFGDLIVFSSDLNLREGMRPSTNRYEFLNKKRIKPEIMIRIPKNDLEIFLGRKYPNYYGQGFRKLADDEVIFTTTVNEASLIFTLNLLSLELKIEPIDGFAQYRDSLITAGVLKGPLTNTSEFLRAFRENIQIYFNDRWVSYDSFQLMKNNGGSE